MAESPEHQFLSEAVLAILQEVSTSDLYAYREADRRRYDFACDLATSWKRIVTGQTIWKHAEGIDKDIRMLLVDNESNVLVYIARDTVKNRSTLSEVIADFKKTPLAAKISQLRAFWIPAEFDADEADHRSLVYSDLKESISKDLLLSIVLGGISSQDIVRFTHWCNADGLALASLAEIGRSGFSNYTHLGNSVGVNASRAKERVIMLAAAGFIEPARNRLEFGGIYQVSDKGRVLLDICSQLQNDHGVLQDADSSLRYVCTLLGLDAGTLTRWLPEFKRLLGNHEQFKKENPRFDDPEIRLACEIQAAVKNHGTSFMVPTYTVT